MTKLRVSTCAFVVAVSLAGCSSTPAPAYPGEVRVMSAKLITIGPGVQVVADADEPLFYSQGNYWLYRDGYWFYSRSYKTGFARVEFSAVPAQIRAIDQPELYVQYARHVDQVRAARAGTTRTRTRTPYQAPAPESTYQPPVHEAQPAAPTPEAYPQEPAYPETAHPPAPKKSSPTQPTSPATPVEPATPGLPTERAPAPTTPALPSEQGPEPMPPDRKVPPDTGNGAGGGNSSSKPNRSQLRQ